MSQQTLTTDIKNIVTDLLENTLSQNEIEYKINELHTYFKDITKITGSDTTLEHLAAVTTAKGKALGLNHAATCLLDYKRTVKFLKGMVAAIKDKQQTHPNQTIRIFYAGCGPYAPFITLIAPLFTPEEIQFSLLEINQLSLNCAKNLITELQLTHYVQEYYCADAVTFTIPDAHTYHIVFSETLDALLYRECYLPIVFNFLPQLSKDVTLIPQNVIIKMSLAPYVIDETQQQADSIDTLLDVRKEAELNAIPGVIPNQLPSKKVAVAPLGIERYNYLVLDTLVHVYDTIWLTRNESSLTIPLQMQLEQPFNFSAIVFTYQIDPSIEFKCSLEQ